MVAPAAAVEGIQKQKAGRGRPETWRSFSGGLRLQQQRKERNHYLRRSVGLAMAPAAVGLFIHMAEGLKQCAGLAARAFRDMAAVSG